MAKNNNTEVKELLNAGVHFGHLTRKWNPNMAPYIYMERNGIHIINLYKTAAKIQEAGEALKKIAASGRKILFVATKKQAKDIVAEKAKSVNMPYITERWPGGMLTNFVTIRKAVKKMATIDRMKQDGTFMTLSKKERLQVDRLRAKLEKNLGSIGEMSRLPAALFVVDTTREHIAVAEAIKLNIPIFAMVDTNCDPRVIDYIIPSNDDASKSIDKIMTAVTDAVKEGLSERKAGKESAEKAKAEKQAPVETKETEEAAPEKEAAPATEETASPKKAPAKKAATAKKAPAKKAATAKKAPTKKAAAAKKAAPAKKTVKKEVKKEEATNEEE